MRGNQTRRAFLKRAGRWALGAAALGGVPIPLPPAAAHEIRKDNRLIVRSPNPLDLETPPELLDSWITPNELFFVRSHLYTPEVNPSTWRLVVEGDVERPLSLTLDDLKGFERVTEAVTMECAGNGRAFHQPRVAGVQWRKGAVGTARWTGVRLADVLKKVGLKPNARHVVFDGADQGMGKVPDFARSVPIEKCLHPATLLAYEMNGEPLPLQHGFPLRGIVPGWEGAAWVKWLTRLTVQEREGDGFFMTNAYRYPKRPVAPGEAVDPADMQVLASLDVKSLITAPRTLTWVMPGEAVEIRGAAWAGEAEVARVEVSTDGGKTWMEAELTNERAPFAWRRFRRPWRPMASRRYEILSRATDTRGRTQPEVARWNPSGYLWNAPDRVVVDVSQVVVDSGRFGGEAVELPAGPARALAERACLTCHDARLIVQQRLDRGRWSRELDKMIRWGARVSAEEKEILLDYFFSHFH